MYNKLMKKEGIFITATGTDVGKTYISAMLLKHLRDNGIKAGYFKPALSGAHMNNNQLIAGDADYVCKTAKIEGDPADFVCYAFEQAVSPHLAAKLNEVVINESIIMEKYNQLKKDYDFILVEGAGGIVCPFRMGEHPLLLIDIINLIGLELIIVVSSELGTINNTVLTVEYAKNHGAQILGIIMNMYDDENQMHIDNKSCIEQLTGINVIATIPIQSDN